MKNILMAFSFALLMCSFQAGAATLSLSAITAGATVSAANANDIVGGGAITSANTSFTYKWSLVLSSTVDVLLTTTNTPFTNLLTSPVYTFALKDSTGTTTINSLTGAIGGQFTVASLAAGTYEIWISGKTKLSGGVNSSFSVFNTSPVPVPAAVWLFGSAFMGLVGVSRRKGKTSMAA
ncbi:hypothetical protein JCM14076_26140 [Methylosoma difficile]